MKKIMMLVVVLVSFVSPVAHADFLGAAAGAIIGGALGSNVGSGSGQKWAIAAAAATGAVVGDRMSTPQRTVVARRAVYQPGGEYPQQQQRGDGGYSRSSYPQSQQGGEREQQSPWNSCDKYGSAGEIASCNQGRSYAYQQEQQRREQRARECGQYGGLYCVY